MLEKLTLTEAVLNMFEDEDAYEARLSRLDENSMEHFFVVEGWEHDYDADLIDDGRTMEGIPSIYG